MFFFWFQLALKNKKISRVINHFTRACIVAVMCVIKFYEIGPKEIAKQRVDGDH